MRARTRASRNGWPSREKAQRAYTEEPAGCALRKPLARAGNGAAQNRGTVPALEGNEKFTEFEHGLLLVKMGHSGSVPSPQSLAQAHVGDRGVNEHHPT